MEATDGGAATSSRVKRIVDCKIENGQHYYKVKWRTTWEPAGNLATYQHLIDEFWSFVNNVKSKEEFVQQQRRKEVLEQHLNGNGATSTPPPPSSCTSLERLSDDSKADVHRLIARTGATSPGSVIVCSPSESLRLHPQQQQPLPSQRQHSTAAAHSPASSGEGNHAHHQHSSVHSSPESNRNVWAADDLLGLTKIEGKLPPSMVKSSANTGATSSPGSGIPSGGISNSASLKYVENFSNPYVKLIIVCKICNREASRFQNNWKRHYLTHTRAEEKSAVVSASAPKRRRGGGHNGGARTTDYHNNNNNNNNVAHSEYQHQHSYPPHTEYVQVKAEYMQGKPEYVQVVKPEYPNYNDEY